MIWAVGQDHLLAAERLIYRGAKVNQQDADGVTALMEAASVRSEDLVYLLLRNGADPAMLDSSGRDALAIAQETKK